MARKERPKKTLQQQRLEQLKSISFARVADEVNEKRWRALVCVLAAPSDEDRRKMPRLVRLYESGALARLPTDLAADGLRMRRVAIAIHVLVGRSQQAVLTEAEIAAEAHVSAGTVRRAVRDLVEASLLDAPRRHSGDRMTRGAANLFRLIYSTVADLAFCQGVQHDLPMARGLLPALDGERPPAHGERPPAHGERPPAHERAYIVSRVRARAPRSEKARPLEEEDLYNSSSSLPSDVNPPSDSPARARGRHTPSAEPVQTAPPTNRGETGVPISGREWRGVLIALASYGVFQPHRVASAASRNGWTAGQVTELLDACRAKVIGPVQAWGAGLVFRHLQMAPPGVPIQAVPREAYLRAARDRATQIETRRRQARSAAAEAEAAERMERAAREQEHLDQLERAFGPDLDSLSPDELRSLAQTALRSDIERRVLRREGRASRIVRPYLLRELARRAIADRKEAGQ